MIWLDHSRDPHRGEHALFSPSQMSWVNDQSDNDILDRYNRGLAKDIGTIVHSIAKKCIQSNTKFSRSAAKSLITMELVSNGIPRSAFDAESLATNFVNYVVDAIGFSMIPEKELYFSEWCYGTADAIMVDTTRKILRIHDLKTGMIPAKFLQLEIYTALFFLDMGAFSFTPEEYNVELRIYQGGEIAEEYPTAEVIVPIMDSIKWHSEVMNKLKEG